MSLRTKFQIYSIIISSFRWGGGIYPLPPSPLPQNTFKKPTQIRVKELLKVINMIRSFSILSINSQIFLSFNWMCNWYSFITGPQLVFFVVVRYSKVSTGCLFLWPCLVLCFTFVCLCSCFLCNINKLLYYLDNQI